MLLWLVVKVCRERPIETKTFVIVAVGASAAVKIISGGVDFLNDRDSLSRVLQAILSGLGFLGAGILMKNEKKDIVHGLSAAACLCVSAIIGSSFGAGMFRVGFVLLFIVCLVLVVGKLLDSRMLVK